MGPLGTLGSRRVALPASGDKIYLGFPVSALRCGSPLWVIRVGSTGPRQLPVYPVNGHSQYRRACLKGANCGLMRRSRVPLFDHLVDIG